jgi:hypothetical protein
LTVVLCGVGADTGNVRPVPRVDGDGRFDYVPIPEKGPTTEEATYGSLESRHGDGSLAETLDGIRPGSEGDWVTDADAIESQPVHRDPNLEALTYGEHRPAYVAALRDLEPDDVVAFYAGFPGPDSEYKHRSLFGFFTVAEPPVVLEPDDDVDDKRAVFEAHPENAHAKRFAAHGDCYYHDPDFTDRLDPVVIVPGRVPGGLLDRAVRLSDSRRGPNYYMADGVESVLKPRRSGTDGCHLGGFKPAIRCDVDSGVFLEFVQSETGEIS